MPLDPTKPHDPILDDFNTLIGLSVDGLCHKPFIPNGDANLPKPIGRHRGVKNRPKGIKLKVQSPGSAFVGAGAILKRLRNSKIVGKDRIAVDKDISKQMVFKEGSNVCNKSVYKVSKNDSHCLIKGNEGSFIKNPVEIVKLDVNSNDDKADKGGRVDVYVDPCFVSNGTSKLNVADV
ncbi:hypothetical protein Tco_1464167 [Tanacetum coccineum]